MRLFLCLLFLASIVAGQNATYRISGAVVEAGTNQPLPKILVQIASTRQRDVTRFATTDVNGKFSFENLAPGKYSLAAGRSASYMQLYQGEEGFSTAIAAGPELDSEHVVFPLSKPGSIEGTIFDEEGTGVRNAQVQLYAQRVSFGQMQLLNAGMQSTKSSGQFHFSHLAPGVYYLAVQAHPWYAQMGPVMTNQPGAPRDGNSPEFDVVYPVTYYPDTTDASAASPITVTEGGTATVQMVLRPVPAAHVSFGNLQIKPGMNLQPQIYAIGPGGQRIASSYSFATINNDQHEIAGLAPGRYEIVVQGFDSSGHVESFGTKTADLQNGSEIDLNTVSRSSVSGHITFEGGVRPPGNLQIYFVRSGNSGFAQAVINPDGSFRIENESLSPGRYQIGINPGGLYLQSIDVKGAGWKSGSLELAEGSNAQISIVASHTATALDGAVIRDDKPVAGAMVLLVPEIPDRSDLIRRDQSDSDGTFTLPNVAPGRYRLLAIENGRNLAYTDLAVLKPYLQSAQSVTISTGEQPPLKINVQARLP